jgi:hypothetical protein
MRDSLAGDVEAFRIGEHGLVFVGLLHREKHSVSRTNEDAVNVDVDGGIAGKSAPPSGSLALDGAGEAEDLLHPANSSQMRDTVIGQAGSAPVARSRFATTSPAGIQRLRSISVPR